VATALEQQQEPDLPGSEDRRFDRIRSAGRRL